MKLTRSNFEEIVPKKEQSLLSALFDDLDDVNKYTKEKLYIDWQEWHDEYSSERTDPCPDYYGFYFLRFEGMNEDNVGGPMSINELDSALCILFSYNFLIYGGK